MKQEDKDLLLKDLCGRLLYGVKCQCYDGRLTATLTGVKSDTELYFQEFDWKEDNGIIEIEFCKPYLFPMSSMTKEQYNQYIKYSVYEGLDWLNKNHFDYRGLISMGLAIDATGLGVY